MGVGLYLNGHYEPTQTTVDDPIRSWLIGIQNWFDDVLGGDPLWGNVFMRCRHGMTYDHNAALFVSMHPAGEDIEFIVPQPGRIIVSAKTSTVGAGYHTSLCQLLHRFGEEMKVVWNPQGEEDDSSYDETGFFFHSDRAAVEAEMLLQLKTMAGISIETLETTGCTLTAWNMPIEYDYSEYPGDIRTPMGVRSIDWVRAVVDNPRQGIDIFPWWEDGVGATFYLGQALCEMWSRIRWRSAIDDDEWSDWMDIHLHLCSAYEQDPTLNFPWREWCELMDNIRAYGGFLEMQSGDVEPAVHERAANISADQPLIGYRRYPVRVRLLDGWSVRIPGEMKELWEDVTWSAWDGDRTVWFNNWAITSKDDSPVSAKAILDMMERQLPEGDLIEYSHEGLIGKAARLETEENGEILQNLKAFSAVDGKSALCNIFYHDKEDYDWAIDTWHSLTTK